MIGELLSYDASRELVPEICVKADKATGKIRVRLRRIAREQATMLHLHSQGACCGKCTNFEDGICLLKSDFKGDYHIAADSVCKWFSPTASYEVFKP